MKTSLLLLFSFALVSCATTPAPTAPAAGVKPVAKKVAAKPTPYPLKTCLVTGDDLDDMDERVSTVYDGQVFEFCCKPCIKKFNRNPGKYVKALAKAKS